MKQMVTISVKIPKDLKSKIDKSHTNVSKVVREIKTRPHKAELLFRKTREA